MNEGHGIAGELADSFDERSPATNLPQRSNALANRITGVLSASYADSEIRDALNTLETMGIQNTPETRRGLRWNVQRELIECNGAIVKDFGHAAEVCLLGCIS